MRDHIDRQVLGVIALELERELRSRIPDEFAELSPEHMSASEAIYQKYDQALRARPDYRLWRLHMQPHYSYRRPWLYDIQVAGAELGDPPQSQLLRTCVESDDPLVQWSTVAIMPQLVDQSNTRPPNISEDDIFDMLARVYGRLRFEFIPLDLCPASCGMAMFYLIMSYQHALHQRGVRISADECRDLVDAVIKALKLTDPSWSPGSKPDLRSLERERRGTGRLAPAHDAHEHIRFAEVLYRLRPAISESISGWNPITETLLVDGYLLSATAWLAARSFRISEIKQQKRKGFFGDDSSKNKRRDAFKQEMRALLMAGLAARDAGEYLASSRMIYWYLKTIPDEFADERWVQSELEDRRGFFRYVGEGGLHKDDRFPERTSASLDERLEGWRMAWDAAREKARMANRIIYPDDGEDVTGLVLHMSHDMRTLPEWQVLLTEVSAEGRRHWGYLLTIEHNIADSGFKTSPEAMAAAFRLALRYGHVRSAGKILARSEFPLTPAHIVEFMHAVRKTTQLDPFGMRLDYLDAWQRLIVSGCKKIIDDDGEDCIPINERLWLHETLVNRTITLYGNLPRVASAVLYRSSAGLIAGPHLRDFYEEEYDFARRTPGVANVETISNYLSEVTGSFGRNPVAISIVRLGDYLSIFAVGKQGDPIAIIERGAPTDEDLAGIMEGATEWFKYPDIDYEDQVYWTHSMQKLASVALKVARHLDEDCDTLFIAGESWLFQLPLQHLFAVNGGEDVLISLTPNLSSLPRSRWRWGDEEEDPVEIYSTEDDPEMRDLVRQVADVNSACRNEIDTSVVTIIGHGSPGDETGLPQVRIGNGRTIRTASDWIDVLKGDFTLIHSCHLGSSVPILLRDMGGVVGLAFSLGCRTFLAPVTEVFTDTAAFLHKQLMTGSGTIGDAYMEALGEVGEVSLYTLYGDPFLSLRASSRLGRKFDRGDLEVGRAVANPVPPRAVVASSSK